MQAAGSSETAEFIPDCMATLSRRHSFSYSFVHSVQYSIYWKQWYSSFCGTATICVGPGCLQASLSHGFGGLAVLCAVSDCDICCRCVCVCACVRVRERERDFHREMESFIFIYIGAAQSLGLGKYSCAAFSKTVHRVAWVVTWMIVEKKQLFLVCHCSALMLSWGEC
jgi:hypothetical protein